MKALLVEDDPALSYVYKTKLDKSGFETDACLTGAQALSSVEKNTYDTVLLDILLPDMNGLQILQKIRGKEQMKNTAIILLTNLGYDDMIKQGFSLGADAFLMKVQYTPDQLVEEVKNVIKQKQAKISNPRKANS